MSLANGLLRLLLLVVGLTLLGLSALPLMRLRPIADDYCLGAAVAENGLLLYLVEFWSGWSGDLAGILLIGVLVGWPLAHLPFGLISLVSLFFVVLTFAALVWHQARRYATPRVSVLGSLVLSAFLFGAWPLNEVGDLTRLGFDLPVRKNPTPSLTLLSWGNVLTVYLIPYTFMLALFCRLARSVSASRLYARDALVTLLLAGVLGLSGLVVAATSVWGMLLLALVNFRSDHSMRRISTILGSLTFTLLCALISLQSPGLAVRREAVGDVEASSFKAWGEWMDWVGVSLIELVAGVILNFAGFVITLTSWLLFRNLNCVARPGEGTLLTRDIRRAFLYLSCLLPGHVIIVAISEAFSYRSWWHYIPMEFLVGIWFALLGGVLGSLRESAQVLSSLHSSRVGVAAAFCLLFYSLGALSADVEKRFFEWNIGPALSVGARDLDDEEFEACWVRLGEQRELPSRTLE